MTFQTLRSQFSDPCWLNIPQELLQLQGVASLSRAESRALVQEARDAIDDGHLQDAQNALYVGLLLDEEQFLSEVQKTGILRISRKSYAAEPLTSLVSSLQSTTLGLSSRVQAYLTSVRNLYQVAASIVDEYDDAREWLTAKRETAIRGLLGTLDFLFLTRSVRHCWSDPSRRSRDPLFHSPEMLADGFSALLALYFDECGPLRGNVLIDCEAAVAGEYYDYLLVGSHLAEFRAWEFLVDRFGYYLEATSSAGHFRLCPVSDDFHRALEYGYIQDGMQRIARSYLWHDSEAKSFVEIGQHFAERCMVFVEEPRPRFRFEFPDFLFEQAAWVREFTQEEQKTISWACREMSISPEDLFSFDFGNGVTINDLFRFARVVSFMHGVAATTLLKQAEENPKIVFNSLVSAIPLGTIEDIVGKLVGTDKAKSVLDLLTLKSTGYIDVLYTPLLPAGSSMLLPVHVFSQCNIFRNPLMVAQRRLFPDGTFDPLTDQVAKCFQKAGASVSKNVSYSWNAVSGECDVIALLDGQLFVCECKNSLLPTGVHELRTSLDHVEKAADQLTRFRTCYQDSAFRAWLSGQVGHPIESGTKVIPAIIVSNRMFLGLRPSGIPVRGNQELAHFVDEGVLEFRDTGVIEESCWEVRQWAGESLSAEDLKRFFEDDITYEPHWSSMEPFTSTFEFSDCVVHVPRLRMNFIALAGNFGLVDLKNKMIAKAKAEGVSIDDDGWAVTEPVTSENDPVVILEREPEESDG
jgi:hypothetical protein